MLAADYTSPIEDAEAKVQQYVGEFLSNKLILLKLSKAADVETSRKAQALLKKQVELEPRLEAALKVIEGAKKGVWTMSSIGQTLIFANEMVAQNKAVRTFAIGKQVPMTAGVFSNPWILFGVLSGIGLVYQLSTRKGR